MIGRTLTPEAVAEQALVAALAGELYVITHEESLPRFGAASSGSSRGCFAARAHRLPGFDTQQPEDYPEIVTREEEIRDLMAKLMHAVEASLSTSAAVREALAELVRHGYEPRLFFVANAETPEAEEGEETADDGTAAPDVEPGRAPAKDGIRELGALHEGGELRFELTKLDQDFLKSLHIRPETG